MRARGFTLVELVVVIVITGIVGSVLAGLVTGPMRGYAAVAQRADLVDRAETALNRMGRELRRAAPNSIRVTADGRAIEFLYGVDGGRYRAQVATGGPGPGRPLDFVAADPQFDVLGRLYSAAVGQTVVVYNTGQPGANAYAGDNTAIINAIAAGGAEDGSDRLTLSNARLGAGLPAFPYSSPLQRFFVVSGPVSYVCDPANRNIRRHQGYTAGAVQSASPGGTSALLVNQVSDCRFEYDQSTDMAILRLTLQHPASGEAVTLIQQVHVVNAS